MSKHTPGPWWWKVNESIKQVELYGMQNGHWDTVMAFRRWGFKGAQPYFNTGGLLHSVSELAVAVPGREHHASWFKDINHPDARLIVAAPDLLNAASQALEVLTKHHGLSDEAPVVVGLRTAIAKAEGKVVP